MDLWSLLFPKFCVGCHHIGEYLCPDCINKFIPLSELFCPICRKPSLGGATHSRCKTPSSLDGLLSCYSYQGLIKLVIAKFKYRFVQDLADTLTELFITQAHFDQLFQTSWTLVPIPLHKSRLRWRGFNQAQTLAEGLASNWRVPISNDLLIRSRATLPQMSLSKFNRQHNLTKAFVVNPSVSLPPNILLIDDIATTCTTLNQAAKVLKQRGAKKVWALTLAQAQFST